MTNTHLRYLQLSILALISLSFILTVEADLDDSLGYDGPDFGTAPKKASGRTKGNGGGVQDVDSSAQVDSASSISDEQEDDEGYDDGDEGDYDRVDSMESHEPDESNSDYQDGYDNGQRRRMPPKFNAYSDYGVVEETQRKQAPSPSEQVPDYEEDAEDQDPAPNFGSSAYDDGDEQRFSRRKQLLSQAQFVGSRYEPRGEADIVEEGNEKSGAGVEENKMWFLPNSKEPIDSASSLEPMDDYDRKRRKRAMNSWGMPEDNVDSRAASSDQGSYDDEQQQDNSWGMSNSNHKSSADTTVNSEEYADRKGVDSYGFRLSSAEFGSGGGDMDGSTMEMSGASSGDHVQTEEVDDFKDDKDDDVASPPDGEDIGGAVDEYGNDVAEPVEAGDGSPAHSDDSASAPKADTNESEKKSDEN